MSPESCDLQKQKTNADISASACLCDARTFCLQPSGYLLHPHGLKLRRLPLPRGCLRRRECLRLDRFCLSPMLLAVLGSRSDFLKRAFQLPGERFQAPALELLEVQGRGGYFRLCGCVWRQANRPLKRWASRNQIVRSGFDYRGIRSPWFNRCPGSQKCNLLPPNSVEPTAVRCSS